MTTYTYIVTREVVETIEVEAENAGEAEQAAAESPVPLWTRDIKSEEVTGRINPVEVTDGLHVYESSDEDSVNGTRCNYADPFGGPCILPAYHALPHDDGSPVR